MASFELMDIRDSPNNLNSTDGTDFYVCLTYNDFCLTLPMLLNICSFVCFVLVGFFTVPEDAAL